jgi:hypothetical protein
MLTDHTRDLDRVLTMFLFPGPTDLIVFHIIIMQARHRLMETRAQIFICFISRENFFFWNREPDCSHGTETGTGF